MDENNFFDVDGNIVVNIYHEKITELKDLLQKIHLLSETQNEENNASKENINLNVTDDFRIRNNRYQHLLSIYNNLSNFLVYINDIYVQYNIQYNEMIRMAPLYDDDILILQREYHTLIRNFYNSRDVVSQINMANQEIQFGIGVGGRRNKLNHTDMNMKDIKELCKANQIKLSKTVNEKRVVYKKKELITKLKRKKII
jgi:hypothetical protein